MTPLASLVSRRVFGVAVAAIALSASLSATAAPPINTLGKTGIFSGSSDAAIVGYDPVAYFTVGKPVKGKDEFTTEWKGAKWKFSSAENLALFKGDPEKYAPQYGGYCAYGVAQDGLVSIEPDKFAVRNGKLYLNYNAGVQEKWLKDPDGFIKQADQKFDGLLKQ